MTAVRMLLVPRRAGGALPGALDTAAGSIALLAVLLGFALRVYRLDYQSLWYDEAFSVELAGKGIAAITGLLSTVENHPPLHFYALHFWMRLAGQSEFAVRYLSLGSGLLTIPLVYVIGRRLLGSHVTAAATLLVAISPLQVYYSQETRMYSLATALTMLAAYALLRALHDNSIPAWATCAGANLLALYTHYYTALVIAFELLFALCWIANANHPGRKPFSVSPRWPTALTGLLLTGGVIGAGYLPWLSVPLRQFGSVNNYYQGSADLPRAARETLEAFATGRLGGVEQVAAVTWAFALLALLGLIAAGAPAAGSRQPASPWPVRLFLGLYLFVPIALFFLMLTQKPKFDPRYAVMAWPAFALLVAAGALAPLRLGRKAGGAFAALLLAATLATSVPFLSNYYHNSGYARDDWRAAARFIAAQRQASDAVVLISGYAAPAFRYYYRQADWLAAPERPVMRMDDVIDYDEAGSLLQQLAGKQRVWLVLWQDEVADPNKLVAGSLGRIGRASSPPLQFGSIRVERYDLPEGSALTLNRQPQTPLDANFGDRVRLLGYDLPLATAQPGGAVPLTLYWQALQPLLDDYHVAVWLKDEAGYEWGRVAKRPASYLYYTMRWKAGSTVVGETPLPVLQGTPPGKYALHVSLFSITTLRGLDVLENGIPLGTDVVIGQLAVGRAAIPPSYTALGLETAPRPAASRDVQFLGVLPPISEVPAGENFSLTTFWEAGPSPRRDLLFELRLIDAQGTALARQVERPVGAAYPTDQWQDGERLRGQHILTVPASAGGAVRIVGRLRDAATGAPLGEELVLAEGRVLGRQHNTQQPPLPKAAQQATLGNEIRLLGYDLDRSSARAGDTIHLRLHWQARTAPSKGYKVFSHLLDQQQRIWAQEDGIPGRGALPTSSWIQGEYVADEYLLKIKPEAAPGEYLIEIGMYVESTGDRLAITDAAGAPSGNQIILRDRLQVVGR